MGSAVLAIRNCVQLAYRTHVGNVTKTVDDSSVVWRNMTAVGLVENDDTTARNLRRNTSSPSSRSLAFVAPAIRIYQSCFIYTGTQVSLRGIYLV